MINDIRLQASQLLQFENNSLISNQTPYQNTFENLLNTNNNQNKESSNISHIQLGIPAGFNIDFSLLEEMEKEC